jgi:hypothetical protein
MQELYQRMLERVRSQMDLALANARAPLFFVEDVSPPGPSFFPGIASPAPMMEKAAFLGVATSPVSGALRDQLKLQRGMGLIVNYVAVDSPAFQAGMQPHDVLEKLEDQWLVNAPQFAALVRAKKPGDSVVLTVIRGGERLKVTVVLAEKELPVLDEPDAFQFSGGGQNLVAGTLDGMPAASGGMVVGGVGGGGGAWQRGSRKMIFTAPDGTVTRTLKDGVHEIALTTSAQGETRLVIRDLAGHEMYSAAYMTDADKAAVPADCVPAVQALAAIAPQGAILPAAPSVQQSMAKMTRSDAQQQIVLTLNGPHKTLWVKEMKTGKVIFDGPVDTQEQTAALPPEVAEKMKWMEQKMGLRQ